MLNTQQHEAKNEQHEHLVQFYENDAFLLDGLTDYIGSALAAGDKGIVIATKPHLEALEANLRQRNLLTNALIGDQQRYFPLDAETLLPLFMVGGIPDEARFTKLVGGMLRRAAKGHTRDICVFGEMVAILCARECNNLSSGSKYEAAIRVENCFNQLMKQHRFSLLCGYPIAAFPKEADARSFHHICSQHSSVIPTESYNPAAGSDRLQRTIASLQQQAFSLVAEVNERLQIEQLLREVNFDKLTGLPNRSVFQDRLHMEIRKAHRARAPLALLFIDLDHFKEINDTLGHEVGDLLLRQVGQRLLSSVREVDTVARLGGDEFTVILSGVDGPTDVSWVAQNILQKLVEPFALGNSTAYISASIGITFYPDDATSAANLLRNADQAMYAAKDMGRNRATYFTRSMQDAAQARMKLTNELREALPGNQFQLFYQPIVDLDSGQIHKAEALLRWHHPEHGLINPADFIPIAEHTGMIVGIGAWVFYEAARQALCWHQYDANFQISVNVSPVQFQKEGDGQSQWIEFLRAHKQVQSASPLTAITVEITEGLLLDTRTTVINQLLAFRDAGIQVSLDDFGTGYSSLSYLRKFDIDYLKIDQSFVLNLESDPDNLALCEAIIVMAHTLGLKVIAEGVENQKQAELLSKAGCDFAQGFLFSRPVPADEFETFLTGHPFAPAAPVPVIAYR
jgi:diguanylate cyclase (GGDEF)-like protein